ncbi:hypothetical protein HX775_16320 [Serratia proteamaculans]|uniref:hypothetical protein n=1 Tax=Serratia proteamaculans TaxID=28151 RepID=UPI0015A31AFC|nr:hypothetical protein [Serratia proteamaculans]NWA73466.1 hypothetical protein [Serratia proteamaculans]
MKKIVNILIVILLGFATLDGLRDTFFPDNPISYIKEAGAVLLFFILFIVSYKRQININSRFILVCNFFAIFLVLVSLVTTKFAISGATRGTLSFGGWSVWIKLLSFYCLMNALYLLRCNYPSIFYRIPKAYIKFSLLYCALTLFFIFSGLSSQLTQRNWGGRLSIGYPTMDSLILVVSIVFSIYFIKSKTLKSLFISVFVIVMLMQNTASGYVMLFVLFLFSTVFLKGLYKIIPVMFSGILGVVGFYVYNYWYMDMGAFGYLFVDKVNGFLLGSDTSSIELRQQQISYLMDDMNSYMLYSIFGKGGEEAYLVESTYYALYGFVGGVGVFLFALLFIFLLFKLPASFSNASFYCHSFIIMSVFLISCAGLIGFYLFPMIFVLAYLISVYSAAEVTHENNIKELA